VLGEEGYGELGIILATASAFQALAAFGLGLTATKLVAELKDTDPIRAARVIAMSHIVALVAGITITGSVLLLAPVLSDKVLNAPHLVDPLRVSAGILFFGALSGGQSGALAGFRAFKVIAIINLVVGIATLPVTVLGVIFFGLPGAVSAGVAGAAFNWVLSHTALRREIIRHRVPRTLRGWWQERVALVNFALPSLLSAAMVAPVNWAGAALLVNEPGGYAENGIYNAANHWFIAILILPGVASSVLVPVLSEKLAKEPERAIRKFMIYATLASVASVLPIVVGVSLASSIIMRLYGAGFEASYATLVVCVLTSAVVSLIAPAGAYIAAAGRMWEGFLMNLAWAAVFLVSAYFWVSQGSLGLASARLLAYSSHAVWSLAFLWQLVGSKNAPARKCSH
jgi:O-antigen/teichoic acid export membrane protein